MCHVTGNYVNQNFFVVVNVIVISLLVRYSKEQWAPNPCLVCWIPYLCAVFSFLTFSISFSAATQCVMHAETEVSVCNGGSCTRKEDIEASKNSTQLI